MLKELSECCGEEIIVRAQPLSGGITDIALHSGDSPNMLSTFERETDYYEEIKVDLPRSREIIAGAQPLSGLIINIALLQLNRR